MTNREKIIEVIKQASEQAEALPWKKAIIVYIELPEV